MKARIKSDILSQLEELTGQNKMFIEKVFNQVGEGYDYTIDDLIKTIVDTDFENDVSTKKKANKALKVAIATVLIYSMAVGIVSTRKVDIEHNVSYEASGSSLVTTSEEDISFKEYADEFVHNLNPVNLIDSSREVRKSR